MKRKEYNGLTVHEMFEFIFLYSEVHGEIVKYKPDNLQVVQIYKNCWEAADKDFDVAVEIFDAMFNMTEYNGFEYSTETTFYGFICHSRNTQKIYKAKEKDKKRTALMAEVEFDYCHNLFQVYEESC